MPATRHVWLVRHGERVDNVNPDWRKNAPRGAWDDPPLTDRGHQQAREVGMRLSRERIDYVFTSPFTRCLQTTSDLLDEYFKDAAADAPRPHIFVEPGFCESLNVCQSPPGHLTMDEIKQQFPRVDVGYAPFLTKLPTEKTGRCCLPRIQSTLEHVLQHYSGNVLIVSHGSPIAACHVVLSTKYKYVGQCTISQYSMLERVEENNNELREDRENDTAATNGRKTGASTKNTETGIQLEDFKLSVLHNRFKLTCLLAGDKTHLTDKTNLRDVCRE